MEDSFTLVLNENRINVDKGKLASKSLYFAALFSHNFSDSSSKEHIINYDIDLWTLQSFVNWIHDDDHLFNINCHSRKGSMIQFLKNNFVELLNLLQLSTLFVVGELTNEIVEIIVLHWLSPEKVIDIWVLSQKLGIKVLQDICLSTSKHLSVNVVQERQPKFIQGTIVYEKYPDATKVAHLYTWDGSTLSKHVQLKTIQESRKHFIGMQVASRGYSVYVIGGEMGLGSGIFNDIIWRYCLLSKKWYFQDKLPMSRRHMIAAFIENKLYIVGGSGRHRRLLNRVDILDIHTGKWKKGADIPEYVSDTPPHCVLNGKLFVLSSYVYIYYPEDDCWQSVFRIYPIDHAVDAFLTPVSILFFTGDDSRGKVLSRIDVVKDFVCQGEECLKGQVKDNTITEMDIVHEDDFCELRYAKVAGAGIMVVNTNCDEKYEYLRLHSEKRKDFENCFIPKFGCFNIMDPNALYDTV
ncbi:hypothetical protein WH47_11509 [Habropoda laboriosa]|uniref:BTB domain-containing protein n=1 Tax=Habropoda laboriosa TaxID=597456 RepID=A0A0L7QL24_9HYME|nr:hypothetical protein WH47_11509 [Habropoda laboriosa]